MAKKKKKQLIKLNNKIRDYFGGRSFEEGIADIDEERLTELMLWLDVRPVSFEKEEMVRTLRRIWSEGGVKLRSAIVAYLTEPYKAIPSMQSVSHDKVDLILSLLEQIEHTPEEQEKILDAFIDVKPSKITAEKVTAKLRYLRHKERLHRLETAVEVRFNSLNEMEFTHPFVFSLPSYDFTKLLLCVSDPVDFDALFTSGEDEQSAVEVLRHLKEETIRVKERDIAAFLAKVSGMHPYLNEAEIYRALKALPPEEIPEHAPIEEEKIEEILKNINPDYHLLSSTDHFIVEKEKSYDLWGETLRYPVSVSYEKRYVYALIWRGETLPVAEDIDSVDRSLIAHFETAVELLYEEMREASDAVDVDEETIHSYILRFAAPQVASSRTLKLKEKTKRRILYHFGEYLKPLLEKQKREALLAKTIRDFKRLFPLARSLDRRIVFHVGPTNSGKTHAALEKLAAAETGYYLAPLRLLALEGYEKLKEHGVGVSLITGEEEIIDEESTHVSSTIEMMNASVDVDVCVIDEIQMIADRDRGWAWANALIGAPAKEVILTGSEDALGAVETLCDYLGEPLEVKRFERKNPLRMLTRPTPIDAIEPQTAVVAFSRREVLSLKERLRAHYDVSVVYGNLSPEVRREEARRFREGESQVLVATDAIAMGLNLPIRTILFAKDNKFDGLRRRELTPSEVLQIAGRAGRYGIEEEGFVGAIDADTLKTIDRAFHTPLSPIPLPVSVMASLDHVLLIGEILETETLTEILTFFADNMEFEGPFVAANIESMLEIAAIVDSYTLDLRTRYHLACAPATISSPYIESVFHRYIRQLEAGKPVRYIPPRDLPPYAKTSEMLLNAEDRVREISLYLWLSFKFPDYFKDTQAAIEARNRLNRYIETSLHKGNFGKTCRLCKTPLDAGYRFSICESCYRRKKQGARGVRTRSRYEKRKKREGK